MSFTIEKKPPQFLIVFVVLIVEIEQGKLLLHLRDSTSETKIRQRGLEKMSKTRRKYEYETPSRSPFFYLHPVYCSESRGSAVMDLDQTNVTPRKRTAQ